MRAALVMLALIAGCAKQGRELPSWTIETRGTSSDVTLPANLKMVGDAPFALRAEVPLAPEQRGKPLSLVVDCYHGALAAIANGIALEDDGDGPMGTWRFEVPATATAGERVTFVLAGTGDAMTFVGFGVAPRLVDDPRGDPRARSVAGITRYGSIAALMLIGFLFVPYLAIYLLDRRRKEYAAILAYGLTLTNTPLLLLGVFTALGPALSQLGLLMGIANYATLLIAIHAIFELGPVPRVWWYLIGIYAALAAGSFAVPALLGIAMALNGPMTVAVNVYNMWRMVQLARGGTHAFDARLILAGSLINAAIIAQGVVWVLSGSSPLAGIHPMPLGICLSMIIQTIVLARQHIARQRAIVETNSELQRQVAERSRELGEALRELTAGAPAAAPPVPPVEPRGGIADRGHARPLLAEIADQLADLHDQGLVHGGLTLAALVFEGDELRIGGGHEPHASGTPRAAAMADDILAFGRLAYELVTGEPPTGATDAELATLPAPLGVIISRCLDPDPALRPEADELADELALGGAIGKLSARPMELVDQKVVDDRYVVIGRLGSGSAGTVYEVERISDRTRLALKILHGRADPRRTARFAKEARNAAEVMHPNVVPVIEVGIVDGSTFVVTPLIDGGSLLVHEARFGERAWADWMLAQVAAALAALHEHGIVHRDLRAANVLVSAGQVKLADVGLAALSRSQTGGEPATTASDMLAFGVLAQQLYGTEPLPELIARCLAEDPAERPSAADVAAAFTVRTA